MNDVYVYKSILTDSSSIYIYIPRYGGLKLVFSNVDTRMSRDVKMSPKRTISIWHVMSVFLISPV